MSEEINNEFLRSIINQFDRDNVINQIILIGKNGAIRNIELEVEIDD